MKLKTTATINVLPVLILNSSKENTSFVQSVISGINDVDNKNRNIHIHDYAIVDEGLILLICGNVGNYLDKLLFDLSGIKHNNNAKSEQNNAYNE